jgi:hypothetical protein
MRFFTCEQWEKENNMYRKISRSESTSFNQPEKGFKLPLKTIIEGEDGSGNSFSEKTVLTYISHNGSSFWMKTPVLIGSAIRLTIDLPKNLSDDEDLKMVIKGKVVFIESSKDNSAKQRVSIKFENKYIIKP